MNDDELGSAWTALQPTALQRRHIDRRVLEWLEAGDTPLAAEWIDLFKAAPFPALGLVAASVVSVATAPPLIWLVRAAF